MSLVKIKDLLRHAEENRYGVAAINVLNFETIRYVVEAAEREKMPVIVQYYPGFDRYCPMHFISHMACRLAEEASVPIAVHLDHSAEYDIAVAGIRDGFPSIMIDGSARPYEENVALTSEIVKICRVYGLDVEAELGHVGSGANIDDIENSDNYTDVGRAVDFVERTGCDLLAIAVGSAHGNYVKEPKLDFDRIKDLRAALDIPLVLHGGSGIPDDQMQEAVRLGITKFNIATEYFASMYSALEAGIESKKSMGNGVGLMFGIQEPLVQFVADKIQLLNPNKFSL